MKPDTDYFRRLIQERGLSQRSLARLMEMDVASLNRIFSGGREVKLRDAVQLARFLDLDLFHTAQKLGVEVRDLQSKLNKK